MNHFPPGVLVSNLEPSELNWRLIRQINLACLEGHPFILFQERLSQPCLPLRCPLHPMHDAWSHAGMLVATSLTTASKLANMPAPCRRLYYLWDLEWMRGGPWRASSIREILAHPALTLIARTQEHARMIESTWNVQVAGHEPLARLDRILALGDTHGTASELHP